MDQIKNITTINNEQDLISFFKTLHDETSRDYEKQITSLATSFTSKSFDKWIDTIMKDKNFANMSAKDMILLAKHKEEKFDDWLLAIIGTNKTVNNDANQDAIEFAAFATLMTFYRRNEDYSKELELMYTYEDKFKSHKFFNHLKLMCLEDVPNSEASKLLDLAKSNMELIPNHAGVDHAYAALVAEVVDNNIRVENDIDLPKHIEAALKAVNRALGKESYAKFYATRGRLYAIKGMYFEAFEDFNTAIDKEDSAKNDYALRIQTYKGYIQQTKVLSTTASLQNETAKLQEEANKKLSEINTDVDTIKSNSIKSMEFIGLFSGIISFTIGGITLGAEMGPSCPGALGCVLMILMAALMMVFSGFGVILHGLGDKRKNFRNLLVFGVGAILLVIAFMLLYFVPWPTY